MKLSLFVSICLQPVLNRNACVLMTIIWRFKCHWIYWQPTIVKHWESIKLILVLFYRVLAALVYVQNTGIVKGEERLYKIQTLRTYRSEVNILAKLLFVLFFLFLHIVLSCPIWLGTRTSIALSYTCPYGRIIVSCSWLYILIQEIHDDALYAGELNKLERILTVNMFSNCKS